jgi:histidinol dehydrogenase
VVKDAVQLARLEGLEGHARAAERRLTKDEGSPSKKAKM